MFNFNRLSVGQYNALKNYLKQIDEDKIFIELNFRNEGESHYPYCSGAPRWRFYEDVKLTIHPNNIIEDYAERKSRLNKSLKELVDIISEFDWDFEMAYSEDPPFVAIR